MKMVNLFMCTCVREIHGPNSTKIWLTKCGDCIVSNNNSKIPENDLNKIIKAIKSNYFYILSEWKTFYGVEEVGFYC